MTQSRGIYLDCAATTMVDERVAALVGRLFVEEYGNAGSRTHAYGSAAKQQVATARLNVARALGAEPDEVVFTSGATESDNLAILGLAAFGESRGRRHVVSTTIEHKAVLEPLARLRDEKGFELTLVAPDGSGHVAAADILDAVRPDTLLVSIMHANNETGALQPIAEVAAGLPPGADAPFLHVDAAQTFGRENAALRHRRIDLASISGHKVFAPKGVGALLTRRREGRRVPLRPLMVGGGQEGGLRPGTQPVPLIAGLGYASELAEAEADDRRRTCEGTRAEALKAFGRLGPVVHGDPHRGVLPNVLSLAVSGIDSEAAMVALKDLAALSNGSACTSSHYEPSHVLTAMALPDELVAGTIRLSWSHATPAVDWEAIVQVLAELRF